MMPFFSIIVPVYNVEEYLCECLESLFAQTFNDFEIIAINDGSTDNSLEILRQMEQSDTRLKIFNTRNQGLSCARNLGMEKASGSYIIFIDSDDYLVGTGLEIIAEYIKKYDLDVVKYAAQSFSDNGDVVDKSYIRPESINRKIMNGKDFFIRSMLVDAFRQSACMYASRSSLSRELSFYPGVYYEDNLYTTQLLFHDECTKVMAIPDRIYMRRIRPGSITMQKTDQKHIDDPLIIFEQLLAFRKSLQPLTGKAALAYKRLLLNLVMKSFFHKLEMENTISIKDKTRYLYLALRYCWQLSRVAYFVKICFPRLYPGARSFSKHTTA